MAKTHIVRQGVSADLENVTVSGTLDVTGTTSFSAAVTGQRRSVVTKTADYTLTAADSGKVFLANGAGTVTFTLPATVAGLEYTIVVMQLPGSGAGTSISPAAVDMILGNGFTGADNKDAINTAASDRIGDMMTVVGDGTDGWYITAVIGTWAREA